MESLDASQLMSARVESLGSVISSLGSTPPRGYDEERDDEDKTNREPEERCHRDGWPEPSRKRRGVHALPGADNDGEEGEYRQRDNAHDHGSEETLCCRGFEVGGAGH